MDIDYEGSESTNGSAYFMVESGTFDLFVLLGPTPKDVVRQYTNLTGVAHLPQVTNVSNSNIAGTGTKFKKIFHEF